jgi:hypothetical protein
VDTNTVHPVHALSPAEHAAILERFRREPIRFLVWTGVIDDGVPPLIRNHLLRTYTPLWGNVWIYAPRCQPATSQVHLLFGGRYRIETEKPGKVQIDGKSYASGETIELESGTHAISTEVRCRLTLQPKGIDHLLNPDYRDPVSFFWPGLGPAPDHVGMGVWAEP